MIGACEFHRLLLRKDFLRSLAKGVAFLPPKTNKGHSSRHSYSCQAVTRFSPLRRLTSRSQSYRLNSMSSATQSAPPTAAENGTHDEEVEALRRQVHELQVQQNLIPAVYLDWQWRSA